MSERILVAEDSPTQAEALKLILESEGWEVVVARDGHAALERLHNEAFDLVLTDVTMPGIDGFRLCRLLRGDARTRDIAVVIVSAREDTSSLAAALAVGVDGWVRKPVDVDALVDGVRARLARTRARRRARELAARLARELAPGPAAALANELLAALDA